MPSIQFIWDSCSVSAFTNGKVKDAVYRALKRSGGDGIRAVRAESKRGIRSRVAIKASYLSNTTFPLSFPVGGAVDSLSWRMGVSGKAVPLGQYPARQTKKGVSVEVERGHRVLLKSAFIATSRRGAKGVFIRPTKARYPMGHRLGLSVADAMSDGRIADQALQRGLQVMTSAFDRLLKLELNRVG